MKTKRLEILQNSLIKKESTFSNAIDSLFQDVKRANGQPINDKRNGAATFKRWDQLDNKASKCAKEIEKTKQAIERETGKIIDCEAVLETLPKAILDALEAGEITQWRKFPNRFFVKGAGRGRIVWQCKKIFHSHYLECSDVEKVIFKEIFNKIKNSLT